MVVSCNRAFCYCSIYSTKPIRLYHFNLGKRHTSHASFTDLARGKEVICNDSSKRINK